MVALTYGDTRVGGVEATVATKNATKVSTKTTITEAPRQTWFARFLNAMMESRLRQAEREIRLYARTLPPVTDEQSRLPSDTIHGETPRGGW